MLVVFQVLNPENLGGFVAGLGAAALYAIDPHLPWIFAASMAAAPGFFMVEIERNSSEAVANGTSRYLLYMGVS